MIYTTYFANLKKLPKKVHPISICGKAPDWCPLKEIEPVGSGKYFLEVDPEC